VPNSALGCTGARPRSGGREVAILNAGAVDRNVQAMPAAVEAHQLVKHYTGRGGNVEAVRGVDLDVSAGEVFGFLGPNGAGKSTTVRMLTTLMSITSGSARVAGVDVAAEPDAARKRIGVALQEAGLDSRQTGRELLILQARLFGSSRPAAADKANQLLDLVDLVEALTAGSRGTREA
jgi:ABC-2 type transport system ATP-binding protein